MCPLALPRASVPDTLPLPRVDHAQARRSAEHERELSALAEAEGLPFELRALGESIRHFGQSVTQGLDTLHDRQDLRERFRVAVERGQAPLLLGCAPSKPSFSCARWLTTNGTVSRAPTCKSWAAEFVPRAKGQRLVFG